MSFRLDARIPVGFHPASREGAVAWLVEAGVAVIPDATDGLAASERFSLEHSSHAAGCVCCSGRSNVAEAFRRLFLARAKGGRFFTEVRVAATPQGEAAIRDALVRDPLVRSWFRFE